MRSRLEIEDSNCDRASDPAFSRRVHLSDAASEAQLFVCETAPGWESWFNARAVLTLAERYFASVVWLSNDTKSDYGPSCSYGRRVAPFSRNAAIWTLRRFSRIARFRDQKRPPTAYAVPRRRVSQDWGYVTPGCGVSGYRTDRGSMHASPPPSGVGNRLLVLREVNPRFEPAVGHSGSCAVRRTSKQRAPFLGSIQYPRPGLPGYRRGSTTGYRSRTTNTSRWNRSGIGRPSIRA